MLRQALTGQVQEHSKVSDAYYTITTYVRTYKYRQTLVAHVGFQVFHQARLFSTELHVSPTTTYFSFFFK